MRLKPNEVLLVRGGLGRYHRTTAVFTNTESANAYMANAPGEAVIAVFDAIIFIAACEDLGLPFLEPFLDRGLHEDANRDL